MRGEEEVVRWGFAFFSLGVHTGVVLGGKCNRWCDIIVAAVESRDNGGISKWGGWFLVDFNRFPRGWLVDGVGLVDSGWVSG